MEEYNYNKLRFIVLIAACLIITFVIQSCGQGTAPNPTAETDNLATSTIVANTGGEIAVNGDDTFNGTSINIPANALSQDADITISKAKDTDFTGLVGSAINITSEINTSLNSPAQITLVYSENDIPALFSEGQLSIVRVADNGSLVPLLNQSVDINLNRIVADTDNFSVFAIVLPNAEGLLHIPVASAGEDKTFSVGTVVTLDGSASSDLDGESLLFDWRMTNMPEDSSTILTQPNSFNPQFLIDKTGNYEIELTVKDKLFKNVDRVVVSTTNSKPVANAGLNQTVTVDSVSFLDANDSSDADGDTLSYSWQLIEKPRDSVATISETSNVNPSLNVDKPGNYVIRLTVNDGKLDSDSVSVIISTINSAPVAKAGNDQRVQKDDNVKLDGGKSSDVDGDELKFKWSLNLKPTESNAKLSVIDNVTPNFDADKAGTYIVQLVVNDGQQNSNADTVVISTGNTKPIANAGENITASIGQTLLLDAGSSYDPDGDGLTYRWSIVSKPETSDANIIDSTSVISSINIDVAGAYVIQLIVNDNYLQSDPDLVTISTANLPPVADAGETQNVETGDLVQLDGSNSSDPEKGLLNYKWAITKKPTGSNATLSNSTIADPTFTADKLGIVIAQLVVNDDVYDSAPDTTVINIGRGNAPIASAGDDQYIAIGATITLDGVASTPSDSNNTLSYQWRLVSSPTSSTASIADITLENFNFTIDVAGNYRFELVVLENGIKSDPDYVLVSTAEVPVINSILPITATIGSLVTINGENFVPFSGITPTVTLAKKGGGRLNVPVTNFSNDTVKINIPAGVESGNVVLEVAGQDVTSSGLLSITSASAFSLSSSPSVGSLIKGYSTSFKLSLQTSTKFDSLADLSITGLPDDMAAIFKPSKITSGQSAILTINSASDLASANYQLTVFANAIVNGFELKDSVQLDLAVTEVTTAFMGRTVEFDNQQTALPGVTVTFLGRDRNGNVTGCSGSTVSDEAGNFSFTNLSETCEGEQLIRYDGLTATSEGKFAGVDLLYNLTTGAVTESPVFVHLPRIDNADTVLVKQNHTVDQYFVFPTIPNMDVTVYAGTTLTLPDGSQPDPFPLIAIDIPIDRLPEEMPANNEGVDPFIVAFQPANSTASQPVAVSFPNILNMPPRMNVVLNTLDPTQGVMVPYGTGTVSDDGTKVIPDLDPENPGRRFGIVNFDWHGPFFRLLERLFNPCSACEKPEVGNPIDVSSGLENFMVTDMVLSGGRGGIAVQRGYRTLSAEVGPFGIGTYHNYFYRLDTSTPQSQFIINLVMPDGNRHRFIKGEDGTFVNTTVPKLRGAKMAIVSSGNVDLRWKDGTVFHFKPNTRRNNSDLYGISDSNANTITFVRESSTNFNVIDEIIDPVGRKLTLTYDSTNRVTSIVDPLGRQVSYTYNSQGTLASVTNAEENTVNYEYDTQNRLTKTIDARSITVTQNTYDENGRVIEQTRADAGKWKLSYKLMNPNLANSPVQTTYVTDPNGNQRIYRFNTEGYPVDVTDVLGRIRVVNRRAGSNISYGTGYISSPVGKQSLEYDDRGNRTSITDAKGNTSRFEYEPKFNRLTKVIDALGNETRFTYDTKGNVKSIIDANGNETRVSSDLFGLPKETTDTLGNKFNIEYDSFGNPVISADALGNKSTTRFDAVSQPIESIDALGRRSSVKYDALGRVIESTDAAGSKISFTYDEVGNLLTLTDARNNTTRYKYNNMNQLAERTDSLGNTDYREYDLNGNLVGFTDRRGLRTTYEYDKQNRLIQTTYADGNTILWAYDANDRVTEVQDSVSGVFTFAYDVMSNVTSQTGPTGTIHYQYDALNRITQREVVGQEALDYQYDFAGNLKSMVSASASLTFNYDTRNQLQQISRSNGVVTKYVYDNVGRLTKITHKRGTEIISEQNYDLDKIGNRIKNKIDIAQPLTTQAVLTEIDTNSNRLLKHGDVTYTYDKNGNRLTATDTEGTSYYEWDARNRLQTLAKPDGEVISFTYDFTGSMIQQNREKNGTIFTQYYTLDLLTNVVLQTNSNGEQVSILTADGIDTHLVAVRNDGQIDFGLRDGINSTIATTTKTGDFKDSFYYEPFGETESINDDYPFQYTGRRPIDENLYYYRARFYDTTVGQFVSEDPIEYFGGDINLTRYVGGNVSNYNDPYGLLNYSKFTVGIINIINGTYNVSFGIGFTLFGIAGVSTGVAAPLGFPALVAGPYLLGKGILGIKTGVQQLNLASSQCPSDGEFMDLFGLLPFGDYFTQHLKKLELGKVENMKQKKEMELKFKLCVYSGMHGCNKFRPL